MSLVKNRMMSAYYLPKIKYYGPIFNLENNNLNRIDRNIFQEIFYEILSNGIKMICLKCGWECEKNSNAYAFNHELQEIEKYSNRKLNLPSKLARLRNKVKIRIYYLDVKPNRMCLFHDSKSKLCSIHEVKPMICKITYCARFGIDSSGNMYVRVDKKVKNNGLIIPIFKITNHSIFSNIL